MLTPFFLSLEREKRTLSYKEFQEVLFKDYVPALSVKEKHILFDPEKTELTPSSSFVFQPSVSVKSAKLASENRKKRAQSIGQDLFSYLLSEGQKMKESRELR